MLDINNFTYNPTGWLERNDITYWESSHKGWFKLFGDTSDGIFVEGIFAPEEYPFESKSTCTLYPRENKSIEHISLYASLPRERYDQIYSTLVRNRNSLEKIEISVGLEKPHRENEHYVAEVIFTTKVGKYFDEPQDSYNKALKIGNKKRGLGRLLRSRRLAQHWVQ